MSKMSLSSGSVHISTGYKRRSKVAEVSKCLLVERRTSLSMKGYHTYLHVQKKIYARDLAPEGRSIRAAIITKVDVQGTRADPDQRHFIQRAARTTHGTFFPFIRGFGFNTFSQTLSKPGALVMNFIASRRLRDMLLTVNRLSAWKNVGPHVCDRTRTGRLSPAALSAPWRAQGQASRDPAASVPRGSRINVPVPLVTECARALRPSRLSSTRGAFFFQHGPRSSRASHPP
ncbi:hypothetical protein GW7_06353 [Heterocephalus glaber]|uniref:Uncharacterized protein n=1 Tax=Heterocephalus glaber TaxID=10181 RepID=G5BJY6_HETGA|nr:hypothetical protein GW7_06353 [Heterocephalus glaber]